MITREMLVANRLMLAMKTVVKGRVFTVTYSWRIKAILDEKKWEIDGYSLSQGLRSAVFQLMETKYILQDRKWK